MTIKLEMIQNSRRNFLIYTTANETNFLIDYINILKMCELNPGVAKVELVIVVSAVDAGSQKSNIALEYIKRLLDVSEWLELKGVFFKSNIGRDFSSAQYGLQVISNIASDEDVVMIRNRSAYGPFKSDWYATYVDFFDSIKTFGLIGNTMNQSGHPKLEHAKNDITCHVQTYLYLSVFGILKKLIDDFPGVYESNRIQLINKGELELSRKIMNEGFVIGCIYWPDSPFGKAIYNYPDLPQGDIKNQILGLPFEHRYSEVKYFDNFLEWKWRWKKVSQFLRGLFYK